MSLQKSIMTFIVVFHRDIDLSGNPLVCDCQLAWIADWLVRYPLVKLAFRATCGSPTFEVAGHHVTTLHKDQFLCGNTLLN